MLHTSSSARELAIMHFGETLPRTFGKTVLPMIWKGDKTRSCSGGVGEEARCERRGEPDARRKTSSECSHSFYDLWVLTEVETMNTKWSNLSLITHPNFTVKVIHNGINAISSDQERLLSLWSSKFGESSQKMHAKYFIHIHSTIARAWQQEKLEVNDGGLHKLSLLQEKEAWASTVSRLGNIPPSGSTR